MYHPESDCYFEVDESELRALFSSGDGALCHEVTGDPESEKQFLIRQRKKAS